MLLLNLNKIRTAQDRIEQVYRPDQIRPQDPRLPGPSP